MTQVLTGLAPTTELEAMNTMLSAIGEAPITDISAATQADVAMALNILRNTTREVQSVGWRFNYETGIEVPPLDTFIWSDSANHATLLNIFALPAGIIMWTQTPCQQNSKLDLTWRPSKQYTVESVSTMVLYDRALNRDGCDVVLYPFVYIDATFLFNFEQMPESARRYAAVLAGRRFTQQVVGSDTLAGFAELDERQALRSLVRDQGLEEEWNMLDSVADSRMMGRRAELNAGPQWIIAPGPNPVPPTYRTSDLGDARILD